MLLSGGLQAQDIAGNWQGTLQTGKELRTVLKISKADGGGWKGILYSIDQGGQPNTVTALAVQGANISFRVKPLDLTYSGTLNSTRTAIAGSATLDGQTHVLNLYHVSEEGTWAIPFLPEPIPADPNPSFEVATIKPSAPGRTGKAIGYRGRHLMAANFSTNDLIAFAYGLHVKQIVGGPDWFGNELFDIDGVPDVQGSPTRTQSDQMLQKLLADRFKLSFHHEKRELPVYAITAAKSGPKLAKTTEGPNDPITFYFQQLGDLTVKNLTMTDFAQWMQATVMDRPVVDQTGLAGRYDFRLKWTPDQSEFGAARATGIVPPATDDPNAPGLYTAIQEQLGLKLEAVKAPDDVIVIDHVEKPSAN